MNVDFIAKQSKRRGIAIPVDQPLEKEYSKNLKEKVEFLDLQERKKWQLSGILSDMKSAVFKIP